MIRYSAIFTTPRVLFSRMKGFRRVIPPSLPPALLLSSLRDLSTSRRARRRERHASGQRNGSARFQVEPRERRERTEVRHKRYLFWVIDVAKYYTSRHCVRTRVLDISIACDGAGARPHCWWARISLRPWGRIPLIVWVVPPRTGGTPPAPPPPGWLPGGPGGKLKRPKNEPNSRHKPDPTIAWKFSACVPPCSNGEHTGVR